MDLEALALLVGGLVWGTALLAVDRVRATLQREGTPVEAIVTGRSVQRAESVTTHRLHATYEAPNGRTHTRKVPVCPSDHETVPDGAAITLRMHPRWPRWSRLAPGALPETERHRAAQWWNQAGWPQQVADAAFQLFRWAPAVVLVAGGLFELRS